MTIQSCQSFQRIAPLCRKSNFFPSYKGCVVVKLLLWQYLACSLWLSCFSLDLWGVFLKLKFLTYISVKLSPSSLGKFILAGILIKLLKPPSSLWPCLHLEIREPFSLLLWEATISSQQQEQQQTCSFHPLIPTLYAGSVDGVCLHICHFVTKEGSEAAAGSTTQFFYRQNRFMPPCHPQELFCAGFWHPLIIPPSVIISYVGFVGLSVLLSLCLPQLPC